jgi:hypothetical protein
VDTKYDLSTGFAETEVILRWCDAASAGLMGMDAKAFKAFGTLDTAGSTSHATSVVGRVAVLRVWCKADGMKLVMDACLLDAGCVFVPEGKKKDEREGKRQRLSGEEGGSAMLMSF